MEERKVKNLINKLVALFRTTTKIVVTMGDYAGVHRVIATYTDGELTPAEGIKPEYANIILNAVGDPNGIFLLENTIDIYIPLMWPHTLGLAAEQYTALKTV